MVFHLCKTRWYFAFSPADQSDSKMGCILNGLILDELILDGVISYLKIFEFLFKIVLLFQ